MHKFKVGYTLKFIDKEAVNKFIDGEVPHIINGYEDDHIGRADYLVNRFSDRY